VGCLVGVFEQVALLPRGDGGDARGDVGEELLPAAGGEQQVGVLDLGE
jgi:hypothetical protein